MNVYRIPRREVPARILLDDGRTLEGMLFTADTAAGGRPDDVLRHLNEGTEDFIPLVCGRDSFLLNKAGVISVHLAGEAASEIEVETATGRRVAVRFTLAGGISLMGILAIVMPPERSRVLDYLNAGGRFVPLFGEGSVTLVQRGYIVSVRSDDGPRGS